MAYHDLSKLTWVLRGWRPYAWRLGKRVEDGGAMVSDIGPLRAHVPGSAQQALREAGLLPDWNAGMQSQACEWVEHRHWDFTATFPAGNIAAGERAVLLADGLDYSGWVLVDCVEAARFEGALLPHEIDLTALLGDGGEHQLSLIFDEPPPEQGQFGYTSRSRFYKPRYGYSWDWCPRIVPVGAWDAVALLTGPDAACRLLRVHAAPDEGLSGGRVEAMVRCSDVGGLRKLRLSLFDGETLLARAETAAQMGDQLVSLSGAPVRPWWPNGVGEQPLYQARIEALDDADETVWSSARTVGFKRVVWRACEGAPADAEPWLCEVNGRPVFLQGANWVPPNAVYHDSTAEDYAQLIGLYRDMGANVLRVWGGGILETRVFYDQCDRAGILVWQELPLSSSGVENCPPDNPESVGRLSEIAASYIARRGHHVSLLLWSGGNELTWGGPENKTGTIPVDYRHPCIGMLQQLFRSQDADRRFIATSPTGPRFCASGNEFGLGLHHDVHGPWGFGEFSGRTFAERLRAWRDYWAEDDALFRSEVGVPGAASLACLQHYAAPDQLWPPEGAYWRHTAAWWTQWDLYRDSRAAEGRDPGDLADYVRATQAVQAEAYAAAARACKQRFPRCGGFIIWMGHDCFPCPANNSVIDYRRIPKPAWHALRDIFTGR